MAEFAEEYLSYSKKFSPKTYSEKCLAFRELLKKVDPLLPVNALDRLSTLKHFEDQAKNRSGNAANKDRKNLISAWNWGIMYINGFPVFNPFLTDKFPEKRKPAYVPPEKDFWKLHDAAEGQDQIMLLTYLHTAARMNEIFKLRWDDVDFAGARIRLWTRKRKDGTLEFDWIPLTDDLYNLLLNHKAQSESQLVFPNPETGEPWVDRRKLMERLSKKAGIKQFGFHAIRHLTASILAQSGTPAILIQGILRHKKVTTTELYLHQLTDLRPALTVLNGGKKAVKKPYEGKERNVELKTL